MAMQRSNMGGIGVAALVSGWRAWIWIWVAGRLVVLLSLSSAYLHVQRVCKCI
jgi:hypothetical protein